MRVVPLEVVNKTGGAFLNGLDVTAANPGGVANPTSTLELASYAGFEIARSINDGVDTNRLPLSPSTRWRRCWSMDFRSIDRIESLLFYIFL